jgi:putative selenate reductase molybdopterin-binding subunit
MRGVIVLNEITFILNSTPTTVAIRPGERLLRLLRRLGCYSVKFGDEHGLSGADTVLLDGAPVNAQTVLAAQVDGHQVLTLEGIGTSRNLHPLQQAFIETGAIQSGYTTPAQILCAYALLRRNPSPTEAEVRAALNGVLDRETGYVKPVQAVLRAAAVMRGEEVPPFTPLERAIPAPPGLFDLPAAGTPFDARPEDEAREGGDTFPDAGPAGSGPATITRLPVRTIPAVVLTPPEVAALKTVGKPENKVDAVKLAAGKPVYTDDIEMPGMLHAAMLTSPHAHARITRIDATAARALPGVHAVLTYEDVPRVYYASGGQSYPNPKPYDQVSLDRKVRHVGDRVAVVAAESPEIAREAVRLIEVEYEVLPAVFDPFAAMAEGAPVIHDDEAISGIHDRARNIVHHIHAQVGDAEAQWAKAAHIFEGEYTVHQVQQASIEPHEVITWWDEDDRLVIRTSTQVPFHVRRMVAPLLGLPMKRIRVLKPRIGGGFGGKQEMLIEDLCAHLTLATGRPVRFEYTREQEFISARSRHPQTIRFRTGVDAAGKMVAAEMHIVANTGAYGTHGLTVQMVSGFRGLSTYNTPYSRFTCDVVYTNVPTPGAYRGYGAPQALFALEVHVEEIAVALGYDVLDFKRRNWIQAGDPLVMAVALGEGREGKPQVVTTSALAECAEYGARATGWYAKRGVSRSVAGSPHLRRGIGMAVAMHGTGIAGLDMGAASLKLNDDGSFNLLFGATDLGTGADTVLAQIAAETLGVPLEDILVYAADTDFTPFDTGAYASSTTYISGGAVLKAAEDVKRQILAHAAKHFAAELGLDSTQPALAADLLDLEARAVVNIRTGGRVSLETVALHSLHQADQHQIMATASHMSEISPPPFAAQFAEVLVDTETGQVTVESLFFAVDCGVAINPITASGQVEGGMIQALGYAHCEEMAYTETGALIPRSFAEYHLYRADEVPAMDVVFVETYEPSGPYGAKAVAEIPKDAVAPAVASAIYDAVGVRLRSLPLTPERVWQALQRTRAQGEAAAD